MNKAELKHFDKPDEVREFPKGRLLELIKIGGATAPSLSAGQETCRFFPQVTMRGSSEMSPRSSWTSRRWLTMQSLNSWILVAPVHNSRDRLTGGMTKSWSRLRKRHKLPYFDCHTQYFPPGLWPKR